MSNTNSISPKSPFSPITPQQYEVKADTKSPTQEKSKMSLPQGDTISVQNTNSKTQLVSNFVAASQSSQNHTAKQTSQQSIQPHHETKLQVKISSENIKVEKNDWKEPRQKEQHEKHMEQQKSSIPANLARQAARIPAGVTIQHSYENPIVDETLRPTMVEKIDSEYYDDEEEDEAGDGKKKRKNRGKLYIVLSLLSFLGAKSKRQKYLNNSIRKKVSKNGPDSHFISFFNF